MTEDFKIKKTKYDISYTYDGALIVSDKFKNFCDQEGYQKVEFFRLKIQQGFFLMKVRSMVQFDSVRRKVKFLEFNPDCNEFNETVGAHPVCLKDNPVLGPGFYRSDIEFARGYAKHPLLLAGVDTYQKLKQLKLKGFSGEKILDRYNWEDRM